MMKTISRNSVESRNLFESRVPALTGIITLIMLAACTPSVQLQAPDKPIEINLNVTIEQHVKIEIEKDVKQAIAKHKDIF